VKELKCELEKIKTTSPSKETKNQRKPSDFFVFVKKQPEVDLTTYEKLPMLNFSSKLKTIEILKNNVFVVDILPFSCKLVSLYLARRKNENLCA
jgi:hypothetical protein